MNNADIEWKSNPQKHIHTYIIIIGLISCFISVFLIFYILIFPNIDNLITGYILYLLIAFISSIISIFLVYKISLDAFPYHIGLSNTKLFLKNRKGKIISYNFNEIKEMKRRRNDLKIILKNFNFSLFYRINNQNYERIYKKFQEFRNRESES